MAENGASTKHMNPADRLAALRSQMDGIDAFLVPVTDEYQSEYPPQSSRRVAWLSNFTGSNGIVMVAKENAAAFADSRYTLQLDQQTDANLYERKNIPTDSFAGWLIDNVPEGGVVGYDPRLHSQQMIEGMSKGLAKKNITLEPVEENLVDRVWTDRPAVPATTVRLQEIEYAGEASEDKRHRLGQALAEKEIDKAVITDPASIAWLLNIRGNDVAYTPLALSYATLSKDGSVDWYIDSDRVPAEVREALGGDVRIHPTEALAGHLSQSSNPKQRVQMDFASATAWFHSHLSQSGNEIVDAKDPCSLPKARKNETEIAAIRDAHVRDGAALTKFLAWLHKEGPKGELTELDVEAKLEEFRAAQKGFQEPSFDTIAGAGAHGAIVHYRATEESNKTIENNSILLLDSGGQYRGGTTDVTRTVVIGEPTDEQKKRFTQVLKGHIGLGSIVFPKGLSGGQLDVLARKALWADEEDYGHGTGHGVGAELGVHEGPHGIMLYGPKSEVPLEPGMVISNEPGWYKKDEFGIRIESLVAVRERKNRDGEPTKFLDFETLTMAPIDRNLIDTSLLNEEELAWLNDYHLKVFNTLAPKMTTAELKFLAEATKPILREQEKADPHIEGELEATPSSRDKGVAAGK